ncbi:MAG: ABC transporter permease [Candidatus Dormibacteraeota bacterium]|nr:ABC transporter permease [Candidatus Dormibacteraeota bacterium]
MNSAETEAAIFEDSEPRRSLGASAVAVFGQNTLALVGLAMVAAFFLFCFVGPLVYHTNQVATAVAQANRPPTAAHLLGTDAVGYDELGRLMVGGQITLLVAVAVAVLATTIGLIWGCVAGVSGGGLDSLMMRIVDAALAIPGLFLLIFLDSILKPSVLVLIMVITALAWLVPSRLVRAEVLSLRQRPFVEAARGAGATGVWVILRHLIPNVFGTVVVNATFQVADAVLTVAALSFLGLGIPPPAANWGSMLANGVNYVFAGYWWQIWPAGVCIVAVVVGFNFIGDGLRDTVDVRMRAGRS